MSARIDAARAEDLPAVLSLLQQSKLPREGVAEHFSTFLVARDADRVVGAIGLERHGNVGLLRSLVVDSPNRGTRLGQALSSRLLENARDAGLRRVFLLTETAQAFFPRFGFRAIPRSDADPAVRQSVEFTAACPQSAQCMVLDLDAQTPSGAAGDGEILRIFEQVRDLPFAFAPHADPETLTACGFGTCAPKHTLLAQRFHAIGLRTRFIYVTFRFDDMPGNFPPALALLLHDGRLLIHVALQLERDGRWLDVDATFDAPLARKGFRVTRDWDTRSSVPLTVVPVERIESEVEPARYEPLQAANCQFSLPGRVARDVNAWFESVRRESPGTGRPR